MQRVEWHPVTLGNQGVAGLLGVRHLRNARFLTPTLPGGDAEVSGALAVDGQGVTTADSRDHALPEPNASRRGGDMMFGFGLLRRPADDRLARFAASGR